MSGKLRPARNAGPARTTSVAVVPLLDATPARATVTHEQADARYQGEESPGKPRRAAARWPLVAVLGVQVALSLRLVWSNTAFQDEALYLRAGHLEWARWLHGVAIPDFPSYFSGAPVLYPPIGALADSLGGLAAARMLSLCLMLGSSALLWATTNRLFGQRAALLATGMFATLAGTQFLGAFATYDAMALFLLAVAAWLGIRAADLPSRPRTVLLICASAALALADAVKYATVLFSPVVLVVIGLAVWRRHSGGTALTAAIMTGCAWLALVAAALVAGGHQYWLGVTTTTFDRPVSDVAPIRIVEQAYQWTSLILVLAVLGAFLAVRSKGRDRFLPGVLGAAALLAPAEQASLHTTVSLQKHVVFGAWFAAIAAGYAMARLSRVDPGRGWAAVMAIPIVASTLFGSMGQADALYRVWPNSADVISVLRSAVRSHPGNYLAEDYDVEAYYLRSQGPWQRWSSTYYFSYPAMGTGASAYRAAISKHYFSLIILDFGDTAATDRELTSDMARAGGYHVLGQAGAFTVWASQASTRSVLTGNARDSH
jgi:4-amino-4-deoxy-L-arabinose transferase-like glycosyltransferase